jgi:hypothetical protein
VLIGALLIWHQLRRTTEALNTKNGEEIKQALLAWVHRK